MKLTDKRDAVLGLRLPSSLKDRLTEEALAEHRRLTDHIIMILIERYEQMDGSGGKRARRAKAAGS